MMRAKESLRGQHTSLLFIVILFFALALCALFSVLIGAQAYENINQRMEENYRGQTALSYISNKVKQCDSAGAVSVIEMEDTEVLLLEQTFDDITYQTMIYCMEGEIYELFCEKDSGMGLTDGMPILQTDRLSLSMESERLLKVKIGESAGETIYLALRSEVTP